ncbi:MAG TPA: hypothetical protein DCS07_07770 [Bdellovibrionales bacterium]|nr:hypothetical protein [Bdellovibrionales bacterium]HCM39049.1 hypothetical protein [Bdellovibrionales bacterium]
MAAAFACITTVLTILYSKWPKQRTS